MRLFRMPPQIFRLVLLTVFIIGTYLVARYFLTPKSFGELGWYRADALGEAASLPITYAGKKACEECHSEQIETLAKGDHKTLSCEACHGASQAHADNPDITPVKLTFSHCARCHEASPSRPKWHKQIEIKEHYPGERCIECHLPHEPNEVP